MKRFYPLFIAFGLAAGAFLFLQLAYPYHLFYREQVSLFLWTTEYMNCFAGQPAAVGCWLGDFLTQFFYYIALGPLIISLLLAMLFLLTRHAVYRLFGEPWACLCGGVLTLWEFSRILSLNYPTASTVCLIGGIGMGAFVLHIRTKSALIQCIVAAAWGALSILLFGYGGWATILLILMAVVRHRHYALLTGGVTAGLTAFFLWLHFPLTAGQVLAYPANCWGSLPEWEMEERLAVDCEYYFGHYEKALELTDRCRHPQSSLMIYYRNLIHACKGDLPEYLLTSPQTAAPLLPVPGPDKSPSEIFTMSEGWWRAGDATLTEHAAILGQIFSPQHRSSRMTRRLAEVNLRNGDKEAATKYLRLLESTFCHQEWARKMQQKEWPEVPLVGDTLRMAGDIVRSLHQVLKVHPDNRIACDYLLCQLLLQKRIAAFEQAYRAYVLPHPGIPSHRLYQEALLVALASRNGLTPEAAEELHLDLSLINEFQEYTETYEKSGHTLKALRPRFANTYWFFCHFARFQ